MTTENMMSQLKDYICLFEYMVDDAAKHDRTIMDGCAMTSFLLDVVDRLAEYKRMEFKARWRRAGKDGDVMDEKYDIKIKSVPEDDSEVLVQTEGGSMCVFRFLHEKDEESGVIGWAEYRKEPFEHFEEMKPPVAWKPLPEKYNADENLLKAILGGEA